MYVVTITLTVQTESDLEDAGPIAESFAQGLATSYPGWNSEVTAGEVGQPADVIFNYGNHQSP